MVVIREKVLKEINEIKEKGNELMKIRFETQDMEGSNLFKDCLYAGLSYYLKKYSDYLSKIEWKVDRYKVEKWCQKRGVKLYYFDTEEEYEKCKMNIEYDNEE